LNENDNVALAENGGEELDAKEGNDVLIGSDGDDILRGGDGNDHLLGGAGDDTLIGGAGNDILTGGEGADIFKWNENDDGTEENPAVDFVTDFDAVEGDVLDVSDLLNTADASDNLDNYLVATYDEGTDQTKIDVYTAGDAQSGSGQSTQSIVVNGDQTDLNSLLNSGNLNVDS
jgi:Ca2+-binding RTX toxin-like protein